jgi:type II secretory pathway pseudopilin PulG
MKTGWFNVMRRIATVFLLSALVAAQAAYQPKFRGDPAKSDSEAAALGYMRTVLRAQKLYKKKNGHYATSLAALVHTGSFTKRMVNTERGDYTVGFRAKKDKDTFQLTMTPKQMDAEHRSFYADEDGTIHADDQGPASETSPVLK